MHKIPIDEVMPGAILVQDIYISTNKTIPLLAAGTRVTADFIYRLKKRGINTLYTSNPDPISKKSHAKQKTRNPLPGIYPVEKSKSVIAPKTKDEALKIMRDFQISLSGLDADDVFEIVNNIDEVLSRVLTEFPKNLSAPINIHSLRGDDKDLYIYKHSLSVAVISMAIGQYLSLPPAEVLQLGKCASMHDIGMFFLEPEILQKESRLNRDEFEGVKRHSQLAYRCLVKMAVADEPIYEGILYHHERIDGTGYPLGLKVEDIPLWSKIIAVADVYDAMTSPRPNRPALAPSDTCEFIMANANKHFEYDIVAALLRRIEFYPTGICTKLSNGNYAVVTDNSKSKLRPTVRVLDTDIIIDLSDRKYLDITILRAVSYQDILEGR